MEVHVTILQRCTRHGPLIDIHRYGTRLQDHVDALFVTADVGVERFLYRTFERKMSVLDRRLSQGVLDSGVDQPDRRAVVRRKDAVDLIMPVRAGNHQHRQQQEEKESFHKA